MNSVFEQTYLPDEIILIDDGSTDTTIFTINTLKNSCPIEVKLILIEQENSGPSVARNKGVNIATNNWIAFLDSDDYWIKDKLKIETEFLSANPNVKIIGATASEQPINVTFRMLLFKNYFQTSSVVVWKESIKNSKFNEKQKYCEDYRSWLDIVYTNEACLIPPMKAFAFDERNLTYGGSGLSSNMIKMLKGEVSNYGYLYQTRKINFIDYFTAIAFVSIKFLRRILLKLNK